MSPRIPGQARKRRSTAADRLRRARSCIEDEGAWCTGMFAVLKSGEHLDVWIPPPEDDPPVQLCALGALAHVTHRYPKSLDPALVALEHAARHLYGTSDVGSANDQVTHGEVLKMFDLAIRLTRTPRSKWPDQLENY